MAELLHLSAENGLGTGNRLASCHARSELPSWITPGKRRSRNETTGALTAVCHSIPPEHRRPAHPHLQPALIEFNGEGRARVRSEEHTSELQSLRHLVC